MIELATVTNEDARQQKYRERDMVFPFLNESYSSSLPGKLLVLMPSDRPKILRPLH